MDENEVARVVVDAAYKIHRALGPGLLESAYLSILYRDLIKRGLRVQKQVSVPIEYGDIQIPEAFRADLIVEDLVIVEIKSVTEVKPVHKKQLFTYLRLTTKRLGLLINFNEALFKKGICRIANGMPR